MSVPVGSGDSLQGCINIFVQSRYSNAKLLVDPGDRYDLVRRETYIMPNAYLMRVEVRIKYNHRVGAPKVNTNLMTRVSI